MPLYTELPADLDVADVVIAGGGTAGCIIASRLSDADPTLSILVIERGGDNYGDPTIVHPALYVTHMLPTSPRMIFHKGSKSAAVADREVFTPVGKVLGGGSSVNMLMYSRAQRSDFESWQTPGWSADEMLVQMRKVETFHGLGSEEQHGTNGPVHVSAGTYSSPRLGDACINAMSELGWNEIKDLADLETNDGVQRALRYISLDGVRQDTANCYLHPRLRDGKHGNLHVLVESQVSRVLFDEANRANAVEYAPKDSSELRTVKARKMVIISSGALGSPAVLERSGVGKPEVLNRAGIKSVVNIPGVGSDYQDHQVSSSVYKSNLDARETLDGFVNGNFDVPNLIKTNDKILGWNGFEVTGKLRPNTADVASLGPEFQAHWNKHFENNSNKPLIGLTLVAGNAGNPTLAPAGQYFSMSRFSLYPCSRGYVHVTGPGLSDPLDFNTGFLTDEHGVDIKVAMWAYKKTREVARRMDIYRGEPAIYHPRYPEGSKAACVESDTPAGADAAAIQYTAEDDAAIKQWVRENIGTTWHSLGTCRMLPLDKGGVVDANLGVYGVTGLKVADVSIVPHNVGAHTNNTAMIIGERAAEIFIKELGLDG
ncbi:alcohol oxidase-like protein [Xylaria intraflava]|nr:alcohol oxidase-like protein [Xylaria intraflava]